MYVACSTQCFARVPLERALRIMAEMEFSKVDIAIVEDGDHLKPSEVAADVTMAAQRIRIGPSLSPAAFQIEIAAADVAEHDRQVLAICRLARLSSVSVLTFPAGPVTTPLEEEIGRLTRLAQLIQAQGLVFTLTTRTGTWTETPAKALELCRRVSGLGITLDPSHYINGPHQGGSYDELFPYVRHVHLRDTGRAPGKFQLRIGQGEIEYGRIIAMLERQGYDRLLSVAIQDVADAPFVMESEVRKLKYLLESLI